MARFKIGDKVILGDHYINGDHRDWNQETMPKYVGKVATIIRNHDVFRHGQAWNVDLDGGAHYWYEANMKPAINYPDQKCSGCGTAAPHGEPKDGKYICDFCKALNDLKEPTPQDLYEKNWEETFGKKKSTAKKSAK